MQPQGPYRLGGYSFGAKVAFEMAQRLCDQGQRIDLLVVLDISLPPSSRTFVESDADTPYILELGLLFESTYGKPLSLSKQTLQTLGPDGQLDYFVERLNQADLRIERNDVREILAVFKANVQAEFRYVPSLEHQIPILLFKAAELHTAISSVVDPDDETWGWRRYAKGVLESATIPGDHYTMMIEPQVHIMAKHLEARLKRIDNGTKE